MIKILTYTVIVIVTITVVVTSRSESLQDFWRDVVRVAANWMLRSPLRFVVSLFGFLALLGMIAMFTHTPAAKPHAAPTPSYSYVIPSIPPVGSPTGTPTLAGPQPNPTQPGPITTTPAPAKQVRIDPKIFDVAYRFAHAWVYHPTGITTATWLLGVAPYTSTSLYTQMQNADPSMIPVDAVTGPPHVGVTADRQAQVTVPGDPYPVDLVLVRTATGWLVDSVDVTGV